MAAPRLLPDRTCVHCGSTFRQKSSTTGRFCSRTCWYAWPGRNPAETCAGCGEPFRPKYRKQRSCSVECGNVAKRSKRRRTACVSCGQPLRPDVHSHTRYCSHSCAMEANWAQGVFETARFQLPEGTRRPASNGYMRTKTANGWEMEHRVLMEKLLGRPLAAKETVHHVNGDRADNSTDGDLDESYRSGNLELWSAWQPAGQRVADKVEYAAEILRLYAPDLLRDDNRPENLELWRVKGKKDPAGVRAADYHCPGCVCGS